MIGSAANEVTSETRSADWRFTVGLALVALLAIGLVHHETWLSIMGTWMKSGTYAHGWLILPFSAWLIWRHRALAAPLRPRVWWPALLVILGIELIWATGAIASVQGAQHFAVIALIPATIVLLAGPRVAWAFAFPLAYLVFAIPWGEGLVPMLQDVTAHMAVFLLEVSGVPVYWEGRLIAIPVGTFEVAEACAGVRYLIAALALGTLFAYLVYRSFWRRLAFIAAAVVVPIVANGFRAWGIIMLASWSDMRLAVGVDHLIYGWIFFGVVMFILFWLGSLWREPEPGPSATAPSVGAAAAMPHAAGATVGRIAAAAVTLVVLVFLSSMLPGWATRLQPDSATRISLPTAADGWRATGDEADGWYSGFERADDIRLHMYSSSNKDATEPVALLVIHYRRERQDAELITSTNRITGGGWTWLGEGRRQLQSNGMEVRELRLARGTRHRLIWSWYDIGGWQTISPAVAKGFAALKRLTGQPGDATLVAIASEYELQPQRARQRLSAFIEDHPQLLAPRALIEER